MPLELPIYQVDAFAETLFSGNPAAVMPLEEWLPDEVMQKIAAENNVSETAFFVTGLDGYAIRWFSPTVEIPLCGHATLASAYVIFRFLREDAVELRFRTRQAGSLLVTRAADLLALDFPSRPPQSVDRPIGLEAALGASPAEVLAAATNLFCVFRNRADVAALKPDSAALAKLPYHGIIVTAPGNDVDFVSRFFAPKDGIDEDPATGSSHCSLIPYWAKRLGKSELEARQLSPRGGRLSCDDAGERVIIAGQGQLYMQGTVYLP